MELLQRASETRGQVFLVVDAPEHLSYTAEPTKLDRVLAESRPEGRFVIVDRSFRAMYEGANDTC